MPQSGDTSHRTNPTSKGRSWSRERFRGVEGITALEKDNSLMPITHTEGDMHHDQRYDHALAAALVILEEIDKSPDMAKHDRLVVPLARADEERREQAPRPPRSW